MLDIVFLFVDHPNDPAQVRRVVASEKAYKSKKNANPLLTPPPSPTTGKTSPMTKAPDFPVSRKLTRILHDVSSKKIPKRIKRRKA